MQASRVAGTIGVLGALTIGLGAQVALTDRPLEVGRPRSVTATTDTVVRMPIHARAADMFRVVVRRPARFVVAVVDPTGATVRTRARVEPLDGPEELTVVVSVDGVHYVELRPRGLPDARGGHAVDLVEQRPATPADRRREDAERALERGDELRRRGTAEDARLALQAYRLARELARDQGYTHVESDALLGEGLAHRALSTNDEALAAYEASLGPRRAAGDAFGEAFTLQNIALVHRSRADLAAAERFYNEASAVAARRNDERGMADALNGLARVAAELGDIQRSLDINLSVLPRSIVIGDRRGEAYALTGVGNAHLYMGDYGRARHYYRRARDIRRALGDRLGEANALANLGAVALAGGDAGAALAIGRDGLRLVQAAGNRRAEAEQLQLIGEASQHLGRHADAVTALTEAAAINAAAKDRRHESDALDALALSYARLGRAADARAAVEAALAGRRELGDALGEAQTLDRLAEVTVLSGNLAAAAQHAVAAVTAFESQRVRLNAQSLRASFMAATHRAYTRYVDVLMQMAGGDGASPHVATAFHISERARARGLLDALGEARVSLEANVPGELRDELLAARRAVDLAIAAVSAAGGPGRGRREAEANLDQASLRYEQVAARVARRRVSGPAAADVEPRSLAEVQRQVLDDQSVLLEYALGDERSYVWAVTRTAVRVFRLPSRAAIDEMSRAVHATMQRSHRPGRGGEARAAAARLSAAVLAPLGATLDRPRVLIVPDGALHAVPFAALPGPGDDTPLVARHELVVLPSASVIPALRSAASTRGSADGLLAVFADPVFSPADERLAGAGRLRRRQDTAAEAEAAGAASELARLVHARRETDRVAAIARPRGEVLVATDFEASRTRVLDSGLARYRILHFATHALVDSERPSLTSIVLARVKPDGQPTNGDLRLQDIYDLRLGAELVVLSACRTALGQQVRGEGVVGLTRGFMHAGVPAVVASLWDVGDAQTAELMSRFYERLLRDGLPPAAALRAAQRSMLADPRWSAPAYWASFLLHGEWQTRNDAMMRD